MSRIRVREKSTSSSGRGRLPPTRPPSLPLTVPPNSSPQVHAVNDMLQAFKMSSRQCYEIAHLLDKEIESGLDKEGHKKATVKCFPSYVQVMPTEVELSGYYLSVDVGGTNARIMGGRLKGADSRDVNHLKAVIPDTLKTGSGEQLFNWVAEMLWRYIDVNHCSPKVYHMGFTFSFPLNQMGLTKVSCCCSCFITS